MLLGSGPTVRDVKVLNSEDDCGSRGGGTRQEGLGKLMAAGTHWLEEGGVSSGTLGGARRKLRDRKD